MHPLAVAARGPLASSAATAPLIIIGASARAAAFSSLRAGLSPWCADLFADEDLRRLCPSMPVRDYPRSFAAIVKDAPPGPWMYTGAIENHPRLIETITATRTLWGNHAAVVRQVRSPFAVAHALSRAGIACPALARNPDSVAPRDRWLVKPYASAGGARISFWEERTAFDTRTSYLQQFVEGQPCAAIYVGVSGGAMLLGVTYQLVGLISLHAKPFAYCGSVGPLTPTPAALAAFQRIGTTLATCFGLRGLFGVDCVLRDDEPWPIEVNPRYTASIEVIEHACGIQSLDLHRRACEDGSVEPLSPRGKGWGEGTTRIVGKALLFAARDLVFPEDGPWLETLRAPLRIPEFADIPAAGQRIEAGHPILTLLTSAATSAQCEQRLLNRAAEIERLL